MKKTLLALLFMLSCMGISAAEAEALYTLTFGDANKQEKCNNYTATWTYTLNDNCKWSITGFNNNNNGWTDLIKCGRKADASTAIIATDFAVPEEITSVVLSASAFGNATAVAAIKSIELQTSTSADFSTIASKVALPKTEYTAGDKTFTLTEPAKRMYYRLVFDMDATKANGNINIKKLVFNGYSNVDPNKQNAGLSFGDETSFTVILGNEFTAPKLTKATPVNAVYSSSDVNVATVDASTGAVTIVAPGTTTINAYCSANETFNEGSANYTITVISEVADIAAFLEKKDSKNAVRIASNATVIYQVGQNLIIEDNSGRMLVYGNVGQTYTSGDIIPGGFQGIYGLYGGNPQLGSPADFKAATGSTTVSPKEITSVDEFNACNHLDFVAINGLTISTISGKAITFSVGGEDLTGYNQFGITLPASIENKTFNVIGFKGSYNGKIQFQPVLIEEATASAIDSIGVDANNAPVEYYNLQGQRVANPENGLFIRRQGNTVTKVIIR